MNFKCRWNHFRLSHDTSSSVLAYMYTAVVFCRVLLWRAKYISGNRFNLLGQSYVITRLANGDEFLQPTNDNIFVFTQP